MYRQPSGQGGHSGGRDGGHGDGHYGGHFDAHYGGHAGAHFGPGGYYHHPYYAHWYHGDWHDHWVHPWYYGPAAWVSVGFVAGAVVWDAPWHWGYWSYYNPYYTDVIVIENGVVIDYSRPIVLARPLPPPPGTTVVVTQSMIENQAAQLMDAARNAFARGDYPAATKLVDQAIAKTPNDPVLHEFRGLILFATGEYRAATAAVYAVLSVGPGWDWSTLSGFYTNPDVYYSQLRALEQYRSLHPGSPEARFLLAYHYMSCGRNEAATVELQEVVRLNPKDQLASQLLAGLSSDKSASGTSSSQIAAMAPSLSGTSPSVAAASGPTLSAASVSSAAVAAPAATSIAVTSASLVGDWELTRPNGESFAFSLKADSTYTWQYAQNGKSQQFTGSYTVADNVLILKCDGKAAMVGQVTMPDSRQFNFKLVGANPNDPGMTFTKK